MNNMKTTMLKLVTLTLVLSLNTGCNAIQRCKDKKASKENNEKKCGNCGKTSCSSDCGASKTR